ncbi:MAG: GGDEF domain-containing protein [Treponema sp.]|nr:GGDEF domain-containing protein [Treponema sp.]
MLLYIACWVFHASVAALSNAYGYKVLSAYNMAVSFVYATFVLLFNQQSIQNAFFTFFYFEMLTYSSILTVCTGTDFGSSVLSISIIPMLFLHTVNRQLSKRYYISLITCAVAVTYFILWWTYARTGILSLDFVTALTVHRKFYIAHFILILAIMGLFLFYYSILIEFTLSRSRRKAASQAKTLSYMANHDQLTGLMNRRKFSEILQRVHADCAKKGTIFSFTIFDIDGFKHINDSYGHDAGDFILQSMSALVAKHLNEGQYFARWGGEEFVILFQEGHEQAVRKLEEIRTAVEKAVFRWQYTDVHLTLTFGICDSKECADAERITICADNRLMYGKQHGKNQIVSSQMVSS